MLNRKPEIVETQETLVTTYKDLKAQIKQLEGKADKIKKQLVEYYFTDKETLEDSDGNVVATYKSSIRILFKSKDFEKDHQELYNKYLDAIEVKTLLIK